MRNKNGKRKVRVNKNALINQHNEEVRAFLQKLINEKAEVFAYQQKIGRVGAYIWVLNVQIQGKDTKITLDLDCCSLVEEVEERKVLPLKRTDVEEDISPSDLRRQHFRREI